MVSPCTNPLITPCAVRPARTPALPVLKAPVTCNVPLAPLKLTGVVLDPPVRDSVAPAPMPSWPAPDTAPARLSSPPWARMVPWFTMPPGAEMLPAPLSTRPASTVSWPAAAPPAVPISSEDTPSMVRAALPFGVCTRFRLPACTAAPALMLSVSSAAANASPLCGPPRVNAPLTTRRVPPPLACSGPYSKVAEAAASVVPAARLSAPAALAVPTSSAPVLKAPLSAVLPSTVRLAELPGPLTSW